MTHFWPMGLGFGQPEGARARLSLVVAFVILTFAMMVVRSAGNSLCQHLVNPEPPAVGELVVDKVDRPACVLRVHRRSRWRRADPTVMAPVLRNP